MCSTTKIKTSDSVGSRCLESTAPFLPGYLSSWQWAPCLLTLVKKKKKKRRALGQQSPHQQLKNSSCARPIDVVRGMHESASAKVIHSTWAENEIDFIFSLKKNHRLPGWTQAGINKSQAMAEADIEIFLLLLLIFPFFHLQINKLDSQMYCVICCLQLIVL